MKPTDGFYVYIVASRKYGPVYTGVTSDLAGRIYEHRNKLTKGFTSRYNITRLVYYEEHATASDAIYREKQVKKWYRRWKVRLIEEMNPTWDDLYPEIVVW